MILSASHINKDFGSEFIIKGGSLLINEREKVAIVGNNGAGKTTLLNILTGEMEADSGTVSIAAGKTIGYLKQINDIDSEDTILGEMNKMIQAVTDIENELLKVQENMKNVHGEALEELYDTYNKLTHKYELLDGYAARSKALGILKGLGFDESDFDKKVNTLSGGQKTRLFLGKILISQPDIIFLDEPTNHLDLSSVEWLESYLINYPGTIIVVSHDRYFINKFADKVIDIENAHIETFEGNYTEYAAKKAELRKERLRAYEKQQEDLKREEAAIERLRGLHERKTTWQAQSREKKLDKIERIEKPVELRSEMHLYFPKTLDSGKDVLSVENISKKWPDGETLFENLSFELKRGEHVCILGDNGTGKTTLLKILTGITSQNSGTITIGAGVEIGYYDQEQQILNPEKSIFDEIQDSYPDMNNTEVRNHLAAFLFTGDDVYKKISTLSGGERGRVSLAKLTLNEANFIILDEPTNHLDMVSKEILEEAINQFEGTVLCVSHDRYFVNQTATRILNLTHAKLLNYIGNYDYYLEKRNDVEAYAGISQSISSSSVKSSGADDYKEAKALNAQKKKKENAIKKLEAEIEALENSLSEIDEQFSIPENQTDSAKLGELQKEKDIIQEKLETKYSEWEELIGEE